MVNSWCAQCLGNPWLVGARRYTLQGGMFGPSCTVRWVRKPAKWSTDVKICRITMAEKRPTAGRREVIGPKRGAGL